jgi:hypothetical protein
MVQANTSISKVEVTFVGGNTVAFENDSGLELSKVKIVSNILKEEVKSYAEKKAA